jgi:hypothetical protein
LFRASRFLTGFLVAESPEDLSKLNLMDSESKDSYVIEQQVLAVMMLAVSFVVLSIQLLT